jgi:nitric oxide reductase NorE protein
VFFVAFISERAHNKVLFDVSRRALHVNIGLTNTLVLLFSSLCVVLAVKGIREGAGSVATPAVALAIACGVIFVALKVVEYSAAGSSGHGLHANHFYLYYFILTGIHLFHVLIGLLLLIFLLWQSRQITEPNSVRMAFVEGGACFWHLVDLLWIILFPLLYLVS